MTAPYAGSVHGPLVDTSGAPIATEPKCVRCGCTETEACADGCSWVSTDPPLCSSCAKTPTPVFNETIGGALIDSARISVLAALSVLPNSSPIVLSPLDDDGPSLHDCLGQAMEWLDAARAHDRSRCSRYVAPHRWRERTMSGMAQAFEPVTPPRVYYFGCGTEYGHFWWSPGFTRRELYPRDQRAVLFDHIDGEFAPLGCPEVEGEAKLTHCGGWTVLAWWDRSVDHRGKANSAIVVDALRDFDQMVALLAIHFPEVSKRQRVPIKLVQTEDGA